MWGSPKKGSPFLLESLLTEPVDQSQGDVMMLENDVVAMLRTPSGVTSFMQYHP
jgi:hypothetical protein